jgi:hypothetical protein
VDFVKGAQSGIFIKLRTEGESGQLVQPPTPQEKKPRAGQLDLT